MVLKKYIKKYKKTEKSKLFSKEFSELDYHLLLKIYTYCNNINLKFVNKHFCNILTIENAVYSLKYKNWLLISLSFNLKNLTRLDLSCCKLDHVPDCLPKNLKNLVISYNNLNILENLPKNLEVLICSFNDIRNLDNLKNDTPNLTILKCTYNQLDSLDNLPEKLEVLDCSLNINISNLSLCKLPKLKKIYCDFEQIENMDLIPNNIKMYIR